jgi:hypothetical protein
MKKTRKLKEKIEKFLYEDDSVSATATKLVLAGLALGAVVFVGALAPNIFLPFKKYRRFKRYSPSQVRSAFYSLKRGKYIKILRETDGKIRAELTNKGKKRIKEFHFEGLKISKPRRWDKKWRIVIFDIPVHPKKFDYARKALREKIKELGFFRLQQSVWIYPYPCEDEILLVAEVFEVERYIEIITAERLLHESKLVTFFNL